MHNVPLCCRIYSVFQHINTNSHLRFNVLNFFLVFVVDTSDLIVKYYTTHKYIIHFFLLLK